ncbi:MAG: hypothetical protein WBA76_17300 [Phormidesmis sp.]
MTVSVAKALLTTELKTEDQPSEFWKGSDVYRHCLAANEKGLQHDPLYIYGYEFLGMAYSVYLHSVIEKIEQFGINHVMFVAREGYLFQKIYDILKPSIATASTAAQVTTQYAYLSRVSTFLASAPQLTTREVELGLDKPNQQGLWSILKTFNLPIEEFSGLAEAHGLTMQAPIANYWTDPTLTSFLSDMRVQSLVRRHHREAHEKLSGYLGQCQFWGENRKVALVDIGWHGTIQDNLVRAFNQRPDFPLIYGLYFGRRQLKTFLKYSGSFSHGLIFDDRQRRINAESINSCVELFEKGAGAPHASTIGYTYSDSGRVQPTFKPDWQRSRQGELAADAAVAVMQQGALDFAQQYGAQFQAKSFTAGSMKPFLEALTTRYISFPTYQEALLVSTQLGQQADDMGEDSLKRVTIAPDEFWQRVKTKDFKAAVRCFRSAHWNAGSARLLKIPGLHLLYLLKRFLSF